MSNLSEVLTEWQSAETSGYEVAEIHGAEAAEDGTVRLDITVKGHDMDATPNDTDTAEDQCKGDDKTGGFKFGEDRDARGNSDETEAPEDDDGPREWTVNGKKFGYNELQTAVSESPLDYPTGADGDELANTLMRAATPEETENQGSEDDKSNESDTNDANDANQESNDTELPHPDELDNPDAKHYKAHFGECAKKDCDYGNQTAEANYCASHNDDKKTANTDNDGGSDTYDAPNPSELSEMQMKVVSKEMDNTGKGFEEATKVLKST
jgi:hypothetical protein